MPRTAKSGEKVVMSKVLNEPQDSSSGQEVCSFHVGEEYVDVPHGALVLVGDWLKGPIVLERHGKSDRNSVIRVSVHKKVLGHGDELTLL